MLKTIIKGILAITFVTCAFSFVFGVGPVTILMISEGNKFPAIPILLIWSVVIFVILSYVVEKNRIKI